MLISFVTTPKNIMSSIKKTMNMSMKYLTKRISNPPFIFLSLLSKRIMMNMKKL